MYLLSFWLIRFVRQHFQELSDEQWIAIMNQIALAGQETVDAIRQISANLAHPQAVGHGRNTSDLHLPRRHFHEEQHHEALQSLRVHTSTVKKSAATISFQCRLRNPL